MSGGLFEGLFQIAYVTGDLDRAVAAMKTRFGIGTMMVTRGVAHSPTTRIDMALAWAGDWMIELVQPHGDGASVFEAIRPEPGRLLRHHHFGHLLRSEEAWQALRDRIAASGQPVFVEKDTGFFHYVFVDARDTLGCFTEHMTCTPEGLRMLETVPRS